MAIAVVEDATDRGGRQVQSDQQIRPAHDNPMQNVAESDQKVDRLSLFKVDTIFVRHLSVLAGAVGAYPRPVGDASPN